MELIMKKLLFLTVLVTNLTVFGQTYQVPGCGSYIKGDWTNNYPFVTVSNDTDDSVYVNFNYTVNEADVQMKSFTSDPSCDPRAIIPCQKLSEVTSTLELAPGDKAEALTICYQGGSQGPIAKLANASVDDVKQEFLSYREIQDTYNVSTENEFPQRFFSIGQAAGNAGYTITPTSSYSADVRESKELKEYQMPQKKIIKEIETKELFERKRK